MHKTEKKKKSKYQEILETALPKEIYFAQKIPDKSYLLKAKPNFTKVESDKYESGKLEKQVRSECNKFLKSLRCEVITIFTGAIPTSFGLAENPAKGIPDTLIFNNAKKIKFWIEYKRNEGGKLSQEQRAFHSLLKTCGDIVIIATSLSNLKAQLQDYNLI